MSDKPNQLPAVLVFLVRTPGRHSRQPDAVMDRVVKFSIRQALRRRQPHVWSLRIQVPSDLGIPTPVIAVADGTVISKVCPRFRDQLRGRRERVLLAPGLRRDRQLPRGTGNVALHKRRLVTSAGTAPYHTDRRRDD